MNRKRIFISSIDQPMGQHLVEKLRNDHVDLHTYSYIVGSIAEGQVRSDSIYHTVNFKQNASMMCKCVLECDVVIVDLTNISSETQFIIKMVGERGKSQKNTIVIGLSNYMTWAATKSKIPGFDETDKEAILQKVIEFKEDCYGEFNDSQFMKRRPDVGWNTHYELEKQILKLNSYPSVKGYVICSGLIYGKDFPANQLSSLIAASYDNESLKCYGNGNNSLPLIHIEDYLTYVENVVQELPSQRYFLAVEPTFCKQIQFIQTINKITGNIKEINQISQRNINKKEKMMSCFLKLKFSEKCCPSSWVSESFLAYLQKNFEEFFQFYEIQILKGLLITGKVSEEEKQKIVNTLKPYYEVFTDQDICPSPQLNVSAKQKPQPISQEVKQSKLIEFLEEKKFMQFIVVGEYFECQKSFEENYGIKLIKMEEQNGGGLVYGKPEFYQTFKIPQPEEEKLSENKEQEVQEEKRDAEIESKENLQNSQVNENSQAQLSAKDEKSSRLQLSSIKQIPTKALPQNIIDQYMLDNVIAYITQAYLNLVQENKDEQPTLKNFIKSLKGIYEREMKMKVEE